MRNSNIAHIIHQIKILVFLQLYLFSGIHYSLCPIQFTLQKIRQSMKRIIMIDIALSIRQILQYIHFISYSPCAFHLTLLTPHMMSINILFSIDSVFQYIHFISAHPVNFISPYSPLIWCLKPVSDHTESQHSFLNLLAEETLQIYKISSHPGKHR